MDEFEQQLRAGLDRSRAAYEEAPDPFARINQRAGRRQHRRRAVAALAAGCVVALIGVPVAVVSRRDTSHSSRVAAPTWSARVHEESGASHIVTGAAQPTIPANGVAPTLGAGAGSSSPGVFVPGATSSTVPGSSGSNPVTGQPSGGVTPNAVTPGGTNNGGTTDGGSAGGGATGGETSAGAATGDAAAGGAATGVETPRAPDVNGLAPSTGADQTSANLAARGAPSCGGPSALAVGEVGVFTAPDRSAEPFSWAPSEPGVFDVVLEGPSGVVCLSAVSVGKVAPDPSASDPVSSP